MANDLRQGPRTLATAAHMFMRHASPRILLAAIVVSIVARAGVGRFSVADLFMMVVIFASWPLLERLFHEYLLHLRTRHVLGSTLARRISANHQMHHRNPWRTDTIF